MKKNLKKYLAILCSVVTIVSNTVLPVSAEEITNITFDTIDYGTLTEVDVEEYIQSSTEQVSIPFGNDVVTYYYGLESNNMNYLVIDDPSGYYLLMYNDSLDNVSINGIPYTINIVKSNDLINPGISPMATWNYLDSNTYSASVSDLAFAVGFAVIGITTASVGAAILQSLCQVAAQIWAVGKFGTGVGLSWTITKYTGNINTSVGTYDLKSVNYVYYGTNGNYNKYLKDWTTINTIYSGNALKPVME